MITSTSFLSVHDVDTGLVIVTLNNPERLHSVDDAYRIGLYNRVVPESELATAAAEVAPRFL